MTLGGQGKRCIRDRISGGHYESDLGLSLEAEAVTEQAGRDWQSRRAGDGGRSAPNSEELTAIIQREVRALFRHSISRKPTVWPQVVFISPSENGAQETLFPL